MVSSSSAVEHGNRVRHLENQVGENDYVTHVGSDVGKTDISTKIGLTAPYGSIWLWFA